MSELEGKTGPTRTSILPTDATERKKFPVFSGLMEYFPDALVAVAEVSYVGDRQHNPGKEPGEPPHWNRNKSQDQLDTLARHLLEAGKRDTDDLRHSAKIAWRALANLQIEIEKEQKQQAQQQAQHQYQNQPAAASSLSSGH